MLMLTQTSLASLLLLSLFVLSSASREDIVNQWREFKITYNKMYTTVEEENRSYGTWIKNMNYVNQHNKEYNKGLHTYSLGINEYSDVDFDEDSDIHYSFAQQTPKTVDSVLNGYGVLPPSVDWRSKGCAGPVRNQGQLGDSAVFVTVNTIEARLCILTGKLKALSIQNVVDCCNKTGLLGFYFGCISHEGGIDTEAYYPTTGKQGKCRFSKAGIGATITGYKDIPSGIETALQAAVANIGPISVAVDASHISFQLYRGGVYNEKRCSSTNVDHAMIVVGYGTTASGQDYWIVKNSWGTSWGMNGYILMSRNKNNQCGIASYAQYATGVSN